jgi:hypothetical protein
MNYSFFVDPLSMPQTTLGVYAGVAKSIAYILFGGFFTFAIITKQIKLIAGKDVDLKETLWKAGLIMVGLVLYNYIFLKIIAMNEVISMSLIDLEDFGKFTTVLKNQLTDSSISLINFNVGNAIATMFLFISTIAEEILLHLRYVILAILYIIGPLALVAGILPSTVALTKGWFKTLLQVSFWIIILRIIQTTMLSINIEQALGGNSSFLEYGFVAVLLTIMTFMVPIISEKLLSGANMGMMAGVAMGAMAGIGGKLMSTSGGKAVTGKITDTLLKTPGAAKAGLKNAVNFVRHIPESNTAKKNLPRR